VEAQTSLAAAARQGDAAIAAASDQVWVASLQLMEAKNANDVAAALAARDQALARRDSAAITFMTVAVSAGPTVPLGEMVFVPTMPARVRSAVTRVGPLANSVDGSGSDGSSLLQLDAGALLVSTTIRAADDGLVRVGMPVLLLDETTNTSYSASIISIGDTVSDATGQLGRPAEIRPDEPLPTTLAGANLRVVITASASDGEVLVVPVAAVSSGADGTARVSILEPGGVDPIDVEVTVGITADGYVAVEPVAAGELAVGDLVVVGR
jgi:multidrug efflux pump subunit AcrA (membrane-fusion protein)